MTTVPYLDGEQLLDDLEKLGRIGHHPQGGVERMAFNAADMAGRRWVEARMRTAGLAVRVDAAGNSIGRYEGREDLPAIAIGSHTDTVPRGGIYDGALGVLAGIACVRSLHEAGVHLRHPVEIIDFTAEEATVPGGAFGSSAMCKPPPAEYYELSAWDGQSVKEHLRAAGLDAERVVEAQRKPEDFAAFLELHVEQGDTLGVGGESIGVVEGIVGIRRYVVTFCGYANHAGTTPMARRKDALVAAAPFISQVRTVAMEHGIVGTVGKVDVDPGAPNVIPGRVDVHVEIRALDAETLDAAEAALRERAGAAGATEFTPVTTVKAVKADERLMSAIEEACQTLELSYRRMPSGAGHDAMNMAALCPMGMLFAPSQGGVSHSPDEYTAPEDCVNGARVLLEALVRLDGVL